MQRVQRLLRKSLQRVVLLNDPERLGIVGDIQVTQQVANVLLVVKFRPQAHRQALHGEQIRSTRREHLQMAQLQVRVELAPIAEKSFHGIVEPVLGVVVRAAFDLWGLGNAMANMATVTRGIPHFFTPNLHALRGQNAALGVEAAAYYSTAPLRETLSELVDFDYLCQCRTRMTVGAVNACSGEMRYFDTRNEPLGVDHVMASGALPPAFGAIRIDGQPYWDGGIYSNTPIEAVLDDKPRRDSVIFAVNVWHQTGPEPASIRDVMGRQKDIQFASRADSHILRQKQIHRLRHVIRELHKQIPAAKQDDAKVKELAAWGCGTTVHVAHLLAPRLDGEDHTKDIDFTPSGVRARRHAGYADTLRMIERAPWQQAADPIEGVIEHR